MDEEDSQQPSKRIRLEDSTKEIYEKQPTEKLSLLDLCQNQTIEDYCKLHRLPKLMTTLLPALKDALAKGENDNIPEELSEQWCITFEENIGTVLGRDSCRICLCLLFHLERDCVQLLESNPSDKGVVQILPVVTQLICVYLSGVRIADHNLPTIVVDKFINLLNKLQLLLGKLGSAILHKEHDHCLMKSFLMLCLAWGRTHILLLVYRPQETNSLLPTLVQNDTSATNLSGLHSYLSNDQWSLVVQRITNFGKENCKSLMDQLVLQKLRAMELFDNEGCKDASILAAKHLLSTPGDSLLKILEEDGPLLLKKVDSFTLTSLVRHVLNNLVSKSGLSPDYVNVIPRFQENRPFVLALLVLTLKAIPSTVSPKQKWNSCLQASNFPLVQEVYTLLNEMEDPLNVSAIISKMTICINKSLADQKSSVLKSTSSKVDSKLLESYCEILAALPLEFLPQDIQTVTLFCFIALAVDLETIDQDSVKEAKHIIHYKLLLGMLDGINSPNLTKYLHSGQLVRWIMNADLQLEVNVRRKLLKLVFAMSLQNVDSLKMLREGVPFLTHQEEIEECNLADIESATALLQTLNKLPKPSKDKELKKEYKKIQRRLSCNLISVTPLALQLNSTYDPIILEALQLAIQIKLSRKKHPWNPKDISPFFEILIQKALPGIVNGDERSTAFIEMLLNEKFVDLPDNFLLETWTNLMDCDKVTGLHKVLLAATTPGQFSASLNYLIDMTNSISDSSCDSKVVEKICALWTSVATVKLDKGKKKVCLRVRALQMVFHKLTELTHLGLITDIKPILQLNLSILHGKQIIYREEMLGFCLETISVTQLKDLTAVLLALQLLAALLSYCTESVMDVVPAFLQRYNILVELVATYASNYQAGNDNAQLLEACAFSVSKLAGSMAYHSKDFQRIAPYVIADIIAHFQVKHIHTDLKLHFLNAIYHFLNICDTHCINYLTHVLDPGPKQIFETTYNTYMKYYHFTGKA